MANELLILVATLIPGLVKILHIALKSNRLNMKTNKSNLMILVIFSITALIIIAAVVLGICYIGTIKS